MNRTRNIKHRLVLCLLAAVVLSFVFLAWPRSPTEPVDQGKAITQWINEAADVGIFEQTDELKAAMIAFGTNAVPFLLHEFTRPISRWRGRVLTSVNAHAPFRFHFRTDEERVRSAGYGLILLETKAAPALPVLTRYLGDPYRGLFVKDILRAAPANPDP